MFLQFYTSQELVHKTKKKCFAKILQLQLFPKTVVENDFRIKVHCHYLYSQPVCKLMKVLYMITLSRRCISRIQQKNLSLLWKVIYWTTFYCQQMQWWPDKQLKVLAQDASRYVAHMLFT